MKNKLAILFLCFCAWTAPAYGQKGAPYFYGSGNAITNYAQVVALWTGCSGSQYLGYDGNCHTAAGSGTVTASGTPALYDFAYWTTAVNVTKVTAPTTKGTWYPCYVLATDAAAAPSDCLVGFSNPRAVTGTTSTDTILFSDNAGRVAYQGSVAVAVTLPTATTMENPHYAVLLVNNTSGAATAVTVTPTTWSFASPTATPLIILQGQSCRVTVDASGSAWDSDCVESGHTAGSDITLTRAAGGLTIGLTSAAITPNGQTCTLGSTCNVNSGAAQYSVAVNGAAGAAIQGAAVSAGQVLQGASGSNPTGTATPTLGASGTLGSITMGNATSGTVTLQPVTGALGTTTILVPSAVNTGDTMVQVVASGSNAMGTTLISSGACASAVTVAATNVATTDVIQATPSADPTGVTGYAVSATGSLYIQAYPTAGYVNFKVCNNTAGSLTPSALTLNWKVTR